MEDKRWCLCLPSCTKILGWKQQHQHWKALEAALATVTEADDHDSSCSGSEQGQVSDASETDSWDRNSTEIVGFQDQDTRHQDLDKSLISASLEYSCSNSHYSSSLSLSASLTDQTEEEDDLEPDEITSSDIILVFQECFGDQWQHQLQELHGYLMYKITFYWQYILGRWFYIDWWRSGQH